MDDLLKKLTSLGLDEDLRCTARTMLLFPKPVLACPCAEKGPAVAYVQRCWQNVLAEYWGFLMKSTDSRPGWMQRLLKCVIIEGSENNVTGVEIDGDDAADAPAKLEDYGWNLVVIDQQLCILELGSDEDDSGKKVEMLHITKGVHLDALGKKDECARFYDNDSVRRMFVMGYIRPYHADMVAAMEFIQKPASIPLILRCIANPTLREPFRYNSTAPVDTSHIGCNAVQESILRSMRTNIEGIQGPPGTGKSTTIFHIINSLITDAALVTCVQNKAVDSIAEKLATSLITFVVLGKEKNLGPTAVKYTIDAQVACDPAVVRAVDRLEKTKNISRRLIKLLQQNEASRFGPVHVAYRRKLWTAKDAKARSLVVKDDYIFNSPWRRWWRVFIGARSGLKEASCTWERKVRVEETSVIQAKSQAKAAIMFHAKAALCTIDTTSALLYEENQLGKSLTVAILDEAGTIPEYKMPLLAKLGVGSVMAIGDQKQLHPFSHLDDPKNVPSGYFHRLARVLPGLPMLEVQYRMHPQLCKIVSSAFYSDKLVTDAAIADKRIATAGKNGVFWVTYADANAEASGHIRSTSKWNLTEIDLIETFFAAAGATDLLEAGKTLMVISFYKEQTRAIQKRMADRYGYNPTDQRLRIVTVDAAQGSEADVVILSCVRSNIRGDIGFVENKNRMCVAISRAKEKLIIVGDAKTFRRRPIWKNVCAAARPVDAV
jgi:hypothetical protein